MSDDLLRRAFRSLERAEAFVAAAAYKETTTPPYQKGVAHSELVACRRALAEIQNHLEAKVDV